MYQYKGVVEKRCIDLRYVLEGHSNDAQLN